MKKITIPKTIELGPYKITIKKNGELAYRDGAQGMAFFNSNEISLQTSESGFPMKSEQCLVTFIHELMHWVFFMVERRDLCEDERLVESMAKQLAQAYLSASGKEITLTFKE